MTATSTDTGSFNVRNFYLGRQPILDRNQALFGYELLFRTAPSGAARIETDIHATASVIAHVAQLGLDRVAGQAQAFLNVDAEVLSSDIFSFLPREQVVLEVVETLSATPAVMERMRELAGHGFRFALADVAAETEQAAALLPLVQYVKMNLRDTALPALGALAPRLRQGGRRLMAEKVETRAEFDACLALGFDFFQGYYFAHPAVMSGKKLSPSQQAIVELMTLITSDADNVVIERAVKRDVTLALNLLRLVNTPGVGLRHRLDSVAQALMVLGRRQLQRWLQIMLYAEPAKQGHSTTPLLALATTRGRLLELLAAKLRPGQRNIADIAFTVGIMSLMDALFAMPMADIVEQIPVSDEVRAALVGRSGFFGELLGLCECIEDIDGMAAQVTPMLAQLALSCEDLAELEMAAFAWSDTVVRYAI
jgi:EAL and modified HD-GYP domain-containing signal transduction protein